MHRKEQMPTRVMLLTEAWTYKFVPQGNLVDVHMGDCVARWTRRTDDLQRARHGFHPQFACLI
jgi:DNA-binding response OmpR family regulator